MPKQSPDSALSLIRRRIPHLTVSPENRKIINLYTDALEDAVNDWVKQGMRGSLHECIMKRFEP